MGIRASSRGFRGQACRDVDVRRVEIWTDPAEPQRTPERLAGPFISKDFNDNGINARQLSGGCVAAEPVGI